MNQILSIVIDPDDRLSSIDHVGYCRVLQSTVLAINYYLSPQAGLKTVRSVLRPAQYAFHLFPGYRSTAR